MQELPEASSAAIIENEEVEVIEAEGVVQLHVETSRYALVDLLLLLEGTHAL